MCFLGVFSCSREWVGQLQKILNWASCCHDCIRSPRTGKKSYIRGKFSRCFTLEKRFLSYHLCQLKLDCSLCLDGRKQTILLMFFFFFFSPSFFLIIIFFLFTNFCQRNLINLSSLSTLYLLRVRRKPSTLYLGQLKVV